MSYSFIHKVQIRARPLKVHVSSLNKRFKLKAGGDNDETPKDSQANCVRADSKRSGLTAWMSSTRWKADIRE